MGNEGEASKLLGIVIALEMKGGQWAIRDCDCIGDEGVVSGGIRDCDCMRNEDVDSEVLGIVIA